MKNIVNSYVKKFTEEHRKTRKAVALLLALAMVVATGVSWQLHATGIALTNETYCGLEEHTHSADCYEEVLTCGLEESEGHTHTEDCYKTKTVLVCGKEESEGHTHTEDCYDADGNLICGQEESEGHTHSDSCYETETTLVCNQEESEGHTHSDACYEEQLVCGLEEHTHTVDCLTDVTADVETAADWEATLPELTGDWAADLVAVAQSQLGYAESTANFTLADDGTTRQGYTRYGAWYGNAYGAWDAMFVSFCLSYAGIPEESVPQAAGAYAWTATLSGFDCYTTDGDYTPAAGDIAFFDADGDGAADGVGIVSNVSGANMTVVQGDSGDQVAQKVYAISEAAAFVDMTAAAEAAGTAEAEDADAEAAEADESEVEAEATTYTASADGVTVTVTAPVGALPENVELIVTMLDEDSDAYTEAAEAVGYDAGDEDTGMAAMDISFYDGDGLEVEPTAPVSVSIDASALLPEEADAETIEVQHLTETESGVEATLVADADNGVDTDNATVEFEVESFSTFTITWSGTGYNATTYFTITVHYVDESGTELTADTSNVTLSNNGNDVSQEYAFSDYAASIDGYVYSKATYSTYDGSEVTTATFSASRSGGATTRTMTLANGTTEVYSTTTTGTTVNVYLVYEKVDLTITNTVVVDGNINAVLSVDVPEDATVTYTWYKDGTEVEDKKVGSTYILSDDGKSLNVALDGCNGNTYKVVVTVTEADGTTTTYEAEYTVPYYSSLQNGSFETPSNPNTSSDVVWGNQWSNASYLAGGGVWQTTGTYSGSSGKYQDIEVINATVNADSSSGYSWYNGVSQTFSNGVSATAGTTAFSVPDGVQFVELNCEASGSLYQDVLTVPGSTLNWWLNHRARGNTASSTAEYDTMYLLIMSTELAEQYGIDTQEEVMNVINNISNYPGAAYWTFTSDDQQWHYYSSDGTSTDANGKTLNPYTVPSSQYLTRFFFVAGTTASGNTTVGNFLDDVGFTTDPLPAVNGQGNLQIKKVVYGLSEEDIKDYTVTFTVYAEDGTAVVGTVTLDYDDYVAAESGTTASGIPYYTLVSYISVPSANKTTGTSYLVNETLTTVSDYTWNSTTSTAVNYYGAASNAVTVLENSTTTISYSNYYDPDTTSITIEKVDSKDNTPLSGAVFTLSGSDETYTTTGTNGTVVIENINYNQEYTLTETTAPDGYNLLTEPIQFKVNSDGTVTFTSGNDNNVASATTANGSIVITVKNEAGYVLPSTGGSGTWLYTLTGLTLCGAALVLWKRREQD